MNNSKISFADFHQALKGFDIIIRGGEKILKWEAYARFNQDDIDLLIKGDHPYYHLTDREGWENGVITDPLLRITPPDDDELSEEEIKKIDHSENL